MKNKEAVWVFTRLADGLQEHVFTCSCCKRKVGVFNCYFTSKGDYDITSVNSYLMAEYPYCHCGAKMKKDPQLRLKMSEYRRTRKAYLKYAETYTGVPVYAKRFWGVDDVIINPKDLCPM